MSPPRLRMKPLLDLINKEHIRVFVDVQYILECTSLNSKTMCRERERLCGKKPLKVSPWVYSQLRIYVKNIVCWISTALQTLSSRMLPSCPPAWIPLEKQQNSGSQRGSTCSSLFSVWFPWLSDPCGPGLDTNDSLFSLMHRKELGPAIWVSSLTTCQVLSCLKVNLWLW